MPSISSVEGLDKNTGYFRTMDWDLIKRYSEEIENIQLESDDAVEHFRIEWLGKKGKIPALFGEMKSASPEEKKQLGQQLNMLKQTAQRKVEEARAGIAQNKQAEEAASIDLSLDAAPMPLGALHPVTLVRNDIVGIFRRMGFSLSEGPEIVDDWHNFEGLNFPESHPARDMQDTFFVEGNSGHLLRTHTSSVQVQDMMRMTPPIRTLTPGRVYRNETISARSHCVFHQVEGLYVAEGVSFADLKQTLYLFVRAFFGELEVRFRPSYFPFTEPSAEMDVYRGTATEADRRLTKGTGWLEILGCGMVDPQVLENCGIDSQRYSGFAFGLGLERIAMQRYGIDDIRRFYENDVRFLQQFTTAS